MHWYDGSIAEAVNLSKQKNAIFVVFVEADDNEQSTEMAATIDNPAVLKLLSDSSNFLAIKLKSGSNNYTHFARIYQFVPVPSLFFIGRNGTPLEVVCAGVPADNLASRITRILEEHHKESPAVKPSTSSEAVKEQTAKLIQSEADVNASVETPAKKFKSSDNPDQSTPPTEETPSPDVPAGDMECVGGVCRRRPANREDGPSKEAPPVPIKPWTKVLNATQPASVCPQYENYHTKEEMDEDCLFINLYVPAEMKDKMAVYVFIHGGAFSFSSSIYFKPDFLLEKGIIFASMNYRQGALGFLSLGIEEASGNAGIKDIILALKWIKDNVKAFGGDKNRITIGGVSSSGSIVHMLMMTKKAKGLFNGAVVESASVLNKRYIIQDPIKIANKLARHLGIKGDVNETLHQLRCVDVFRLIEAQSTLPLDSSFKLSLPTPFAPCIENNFAHAVFTDPLLVEANKTGFIQNVSILMGYNSQEGATIVRNSNYTEIFKDMKRNPEKLISMEIEYPVGSNESKALAKSISKFYFGDEFLSNYTLQNIIDLHSDTIYINPLNLWMKLYKERMESKPLYRYLFDFDGDLNFVKIKFNMNVSGTAHGDLDGYIFRIVTTEEHLRKTDMRNRGMIHVMTSFIANFVKYGNPTPDDSGIIWPETDKNGRHLVITDRLKVVNHPPYPERIQFWEDRFDEYQTYLDNGGRIEPKSFI